MIVKKLHIDGIPALLYGETSAKIYIYVHGKYSSKEAAEGFAELATRKGYQVVSFDLPCHGERAKDSRACTPQDAVADLRTVFSSIEHRYGEYYLFACSMGAFFSLLAYRDVPFASCLFLSPLLNMERIISNMMRLEGVTPDRLKDEREIPTRFDEALSWDYYRYVVEHPIVSWNPPTSVLYGERDLITEKDVLLDFSQRFGCDIEIMKDGEHFFHTPEQVAFLESWIARHT